VLSLPGGLDPDEFVKANGAAAYRELLEQAPQFFDYLISRVPGKFDLARPEGKADAARYLLEYVTRLPDRIVRVEMATRLADRLGLDRDLLGKELRAAAAERRHAPAASAGNRTGASHVEKVLLRLFVNNADARNRYLQPLAKLMTSTPALAAMPVRPILEAAAAMCGDGSESLDVSALQDRLKDPERQILAHALNSEEIEELALDQARGYIEELARRPLQARVEELRTLIRQVEQSGDMSQALQLLGEKKTLERQLAAQYLLDNKPPSVG
jgi:DNA primase